MANAAEGFDLLSAALTESGLDASVDLVVGDAAASKDHAQLVTANGNHGTASAAADFCEVDMFAQALQQLTESNKSVIQDVPLPAVPASYCSVPTVTGVQSERTSHVITTTAPGVMSSTVNAGAPTTTLLIQQPSAAPQPRLASQQPRLITLPGSALTAGGTFTTVSSPYVQVLSTGHGGTLVTTSLGQLSSAPMLVQLQQRPLTTYMGGSSVLAGLHASASSPAFVNGGSNVHFNGGAAVLPRTATVAGLSTTVQSMAVRVDGEGRAKDNGEEAEEEEEELGVAETYADYMPSKLRLGVRHPDPVVETSSLSSVEPPNVTYDLALPERIVDSGDLSALQLEAIVYACQRHERLLPSKERAGFLIGDGAGVGKGRTIAGLIYENYLRGRKRAIWFSVSNDLKVDAERDLKDIGASKIQVHSLNKLKYAKISSKENGNIKKGIIFGTYSSLIGESQSSGKYRTRMKMLQKWCGEDFDGLIVFDECHKAKNLCPAGSSKPTKTGQAVHDLQQQLPLARVVYASATGATEPRNMAYMTRLGLWGVGTPFREFNDFIMAVERRGVGAMELVAMDMKLRGMYIARQLSFKGVQFRVEDIPISKDFIRVYNASVQLWVETREKFAAAVELLDGERQMRKSMWGQFWSAHQRFFKYLCISSKVRHVVQIAKEAIKNGKCVVIGLQSTGEARTLEQIEESGNELTDFVSTAKGVFQSLLEKHFPAADRTKTHDLFGGSTLSSIFNDDELQSIVKGRAKLKLSSNIKNDPDSKGLSRPAKTSKAATDSSDDEKDSPQKHANSDSPDDSESDDVDGGSDDDRFFVGDSEDDDVNPFGSDSDDDLPWLKKSRRKRKNSFRKSGSKSKKLKLETKKEKAANPDLPGNGSVSSIMSKKAGAADDDFDRLCDQAFGKASMLKKESTSVGSPRPEIAVSATEARQRTQEMKAELLAKLEALGDRLPPNALDALVDELGGPENVAEMTGRKGRVVADANGTIIYESRSENDVPLEQLNLEEKKRFMNGDKLVAIISEAASSGISLQSDRRAMNQRRRVHITLELPWSADRAVQQFGRTHRSNQVNAPEYLFLISELAGERRFASTVAKRLESLGALTHGDRRATESRDLSQFNFDNKYGRTALEIVMKSVLGLERPLVALPKDISGGDFISQVKKALIGVGMVCIDERCNIPTLDKDYNNISKFLNRILGIEVELQNALFKYFTDTLAAVILQAKRNGRWDLGILDLGSGGEQVKVCETWAFENNYGGSVAKTELLKINVERGMTWEMAKKLYYDLCEETDDGFYIGTAEKQVAVLAVIQGNSKKDKLSKDKLCKIYRPHMGLSARLEKLTELKKRCKHVLPDVAEDSWTDQYEKSLMQCTHVYYRGSCRRSASTGSQCSIGLRTRTYYVLTGSVLSVWSKVENVLTMSQPGGNHSKMQIVRLRINKDNTRQERRIVGTIIPGSCIGALRSELSAQGTAVPTGTYGQPSMPTNPPVTQNRVAEVAKLDITAPVDRIRMAHPQSLVVRTAPVAVFPQSRAPAVGTLEDSVTDAAAKCTAESKNVEQVIALDMPMVL